jgi:hypothetical protein
VAEGLHQGHEGPRDGRGAGAAVRLNHVAVHPEGSLTQALQVHHRPQGPPDEALDLVGAAGRAAPAGLPLDAAGGGAGEHAVLRGDPALTLAFEKGRDAVFHADRAHHLGVTHLDEGGALGVPQESWGDGHRAQLVQTPPVAAGARALPFQETGVDLLLKVSDAKAHGRAPPATGLLVRGAISSP